MLQNYTKTYLLCCEQGVRKPKEDQFTDRNFSSSWNYIFMATTNTSQSQSPIDRYAFYGSDTYLVSISCTSARSFNFMHVALVVRGVGRTCHFTPCITLQQLTLFTWKFLATCRNPFITVNCHCRCYLILTWVTESSQISVVGFRKIYRGGNQNTGVELPFLLELMFHFTPSPGVR